MTDTQQSPATLSHKFLERQSCLSDLASCRTFDESRRKVSGLKPLFVNFRSVTL